MYYLFNFILLFLQYIQNFAKSTFNIINKTNTCNLTEAINLPIFYENKYETKYKMISQSIDLTEEKLNSLKNNIIMEFTPLGNVILFYDNEKKAFNYYSDKVIPYRYLDVCSRKYVLTYFCKEIYIDLKNEIKLGIDKQSASLLSPEINPIQPPTIEVKRGPFAKFKNYGLEKPLIPKKRVSNRIVSKYAKTNLEQPILGGLMVLKERVNKYVYMGKLSGYNFLKTSQKKLEVDDTISYKNFKNNKLK